MQPYLFPYLGYYQLVKAVDEFVFLDDVNFIKRGYVNRNSILMDGKAYRFTLAVEDISQFRTIQDHRYMPNMGRKLLQQLHHAYFKAPYYTAVRGLVEGVVASEDLSVAAVNARSIIDVFRYLNIERSFFSSSELDPSRADSGADRLICLCEHRRSSIYINASGGKALYDPARFAQHGLKLGFIQPHFAEYPQKSPAFVAGLSIIDVLMWNAPGQVAKMLDDVTIEFPTPPWNH